MMCDVIREKIIEERLKETKPEEIVSIIKEYCEGIIDF